LTNFTVMEMCRVRGPLEASRHVATMTRETELLPADLLCPPRTTCFKLKLRAYTPLRSSSKCF
jgi:hypothetical protein